MLERQSHHPLITAAQKNNADEIRKLLANEAYIDAANEVGDTALLSAGSEATFQLLMQLGANINIISNYGHTALIYSLSKGYTNATRALLESDHLTAETVNSIRMVRDGLPPSQTSALFIAVFRAIRNFNEYREIILLLLKKGANRYAIVGKTTAFDFCTDNVRLLLRESPEHPLENPVRFVLDIDGILTLLLNRPEGDFKELAEKAPHLKWFVDRNLLIQAFGMYLLYPGTVEFIQYLHRIPQSLVVFYSGGADDRNLLFVKQLLSKAIAEQEVDAINIRQRVFSRQHLVGNCYDQKEKIMRRHNQSFKNLKFVIDRLAELPNTILIDDQQGYACPGQEENALIVPVEEATEKDIETFDPLTKPYFLFDMNHIFYIVGMIKRILTNQTSLSAELFQLQYVKFQKEKLIGQFQDLATDTRYYLSGLLELQKINPNVSFYGGEIADLFFKSDFILQKIKKLGEKPCQSVVSFLVGSDNANILFWREQTITLFAAKKTPKKVDLPSSHKSHALNL